MMLRWPRPLIPAAALTGCGYNDFQRPTSSRSRPGAEVLNQYQRRADLVPNLVATVKGRGQLRSRRR